VRILLTRTDRIGDVVLTTPAIKAVRDRYPDAYIAFLVRPYARDIVEGNPYLDEVIIYDKYGRHKGPLGTLGFVFGLRKKRFDLAVMLHPTNRVHLLAFLAGIPERIGYDRKMPFLLTKRIPHLKQKGEKHELEYTLEVLRLIGIDAKDKGTVVRVSAKDEGKVERILDEYHVGRDVPLVAVNPGASCASKRWSPENFARLCDGLAAEFKARIAIISDTANAEFADAVAARMRHEPVNLAGKTTVGELAGLLAKCKLFISNDSGPVHIASAFKVPVISIFGRKDPGLSPKRWGPTFEKSAVFHKDVGCDPCLAHECKIGHKCLQAITPDEVLSIARHLLA
jgi:heptosyltransferase-2